MESQSADSCRISIYASDTNNVLSRILQLFGKSRFDVSYIQVFNTRDENLKLIVVEASFPKEMMTLIVSRIEKIIEVHRAFPHAEEEQKPTAC
ncbi:ACT domain-containing protein [Dyadobacter sp. CY323]|uniref:ACT domain-containing protein n=1 Tax=Dyadobacter sp. CY323 TaxID=2907302 RepID=UPI001F2898F8|nr:ACT domain-containing protein [Dyadobacter sp. CY323]MCE6988085.1 ACT domain-containing protein [Dyadobacter sp. CY323]